MLIANLIGKEDFSVAPEVTRYLKVFCDIVCYTGWDTDPEILSEIKDEGASTANIKNDFIAFESMMYEVAWDHVSSYAAHGDWILTLKINELFWGIETLAKVVKSNVHVAGIKLLNISGLPIMSNEEVLVEPRLFRYHIGTGDFWHNRPWPFYVEHILRRPYDVWWDTDMYVQSLVDDDSDTLFLRPHFEELY